jgi:hypothetical protein
MQHHRNYSYDNASDSYGHPLAIQHGSTYATSANLDQSTYGHQPNTTGQYYVSTPSSMSTTTSESSAHCYPNALPATQHGSRYHADHTSDPRYYQSQGLPVSSSIPYGSQSSYYSGQFSNPTDQRTQQSHHAGHFIPTPSELTQTYANYSRHMTSPQTSARSPEQYGTNHEYTMSRGPLQQPSRVSTSSRSRAGAGNSPTPASSGERFPCEKCGKTFSRSHDRKRHHETQHLPTPVVHRCQYCEKEFSRADSLKRHLDNGCDEMP